MKLVTCPFQQAGCTTPMPQGLLEKHCTEYLGQHLLQILDKMQKHEGAIVAQAQQIGLLEKAMSVAQRSEAVDVGSLLLSMKERESHIKSLELEVKKLRQDLKAADCKAEILQIRKELHNMQQKGNTAP
jgi:homogentisate solanesyltransferase